MPSVRTPVHSTLHAGRHSSVKRPPWSVVRPQMDKRLRCRTEGAPPHELGTPIRFLVFEDKIDLGAQSVGCTRSHFTRKET